MTLRPRESRTLDALRLLGEATSLEVACCLCVKPITVQQDLLSLRSAGLVRVVRQTTTPGRGGSRLVNVYRAAPQQPFAALMAAWPLSMGKPSMLGARRVEFDRHPGAQDA